MKKTLKKIAMILIIVMLCNMFTGCSLLVPDLYPLTLVIDIPLLAGLVVGLVMVVIELGGEARDSAKAAARPPRRTSPDSYGPVSSLPEKERSSLMVRIDAMPEWELVSVTEAFNSLPEAELNSFYQRVYSQSETEWVSVVEAINAFSERELAAIVAKFNSMTEAEIASSVESVNSLPETIPLARVIQNLGWR
jgi:hypothetical protein